jgi:hypothetical protein
LARVLIHIPEPNKHLVLFYGVSQPDSCDLPGRRLRPGRGGR